MCMTKNDLINDVVASLAVSMTSDQISLIKSVFIVKMQGYEIYEENTLPSTEVVEIGRASCRERVLPPV